MLVISAALKEIRGRKTRRSRLASATQHVQGQPVLSSTLSQTIKKEKKNTKKIPALKRCR